MVLDIPTLLAAPVAVRHRALRLAAIQFGATPEDMGRTQVLAVDAFVTNWRGQAQHQLPGGVIVGRRGQELLFSYAGGDTWAANRQRRQREPLMGVACGRLSGD